MRFCVSLRYSSIDDCITSIERLDADLVEHRIDFLECTKGIEEVYSSTHVPVIATNRPIREGGHFAGSERNRISLLRAAISSGASFVDIEYESPMWSRSSIIDYAHDAGCGVILSKHYFEGTPPFEYLKGTMEDMISLAPDIIKIVTFAKRIDDGHRILRLYSYNQKHKCDLIAFSMGFLGTYTRILSTLFGAPFAYVATNSGNETAPGQLSLPEMKEIMEVFNT